MSSWFLIQEDNPEPPDTTPAHINATDEYFNDGYHSDIVVSFKNILSTVCQYNLVMSCRAPSCLYT